MNPERWQQIDRLFHAAMSRPAAERARLLDRDCATDPALRFEVESLLAAHERAGSSFIESCPFQAPLMGGLESAPPIPLGRRIGRYALRGVLGHGGTGIVYEAEQENPRRTVALKVMRPLAFADALTMRLFRREGQALARLDHPSIAAIHEAGEEDGFCYFAMERVTGVSLTTFAVEHQLSLRQRLELFGRVCDAVHYAHQRGVIHRDLKPSNILVTAAGQPKVLDFGLARIAEPGMEHTQLTEPGAFQGTLVYASPEHVRGGEVDTRSDVYSLGIVLFELLTGQLPYNLKNKPLPEAARTICEQPPRSPGSVDRALRGDLTTIVGKALEKVPDRRYTSVAALAEDVQRFLDNKPIAAHPPSTLYQIRKFAARHRGTVAAATSVTLLLTAAAVWLTVLYARALNAEKLAEDEARQARLKAETAERIKQFMSGVFGASNPRPSSAPALTAEELLENGVASINTQLADEPALHAELLEIMGMTFHRLGKFARAVELHELAWKRRTEAFGEQAPHVAASLLNLGVTLHELDRFREAERYVRRSLEIFRANFGMENYFSATALSSLARVISERDPPTAEPMHREVLRIFHKLHPDGAGPVPRDELYLAETLVRLGENEEAERLCERAIAFFRDVADGDIRAPRAYRILAIARLQQQRYDEARAACASASDIHADVFGPGPHLRRVELLVTRAQIEREANRPAEARALYEEAIAVARAVHTHPHLDLAQALSGLAAVLPDLGEGSAVLPLLEESLAIHRALLDPPDPRLVQVEQALASALGADGPADAAAAAAAIDPAALTASDEPAP